MLDAIPPEHRNRPLGETGPYGLHGWDYGEPTNCEECGGEIDRYTTSQDCAECAGVFCDDCVGIESDLCRTCEKRAP